MQFKTSQLDDWAEAFRQQAERCGQTLSEWVGDCLLANLSRDLRKGLSERKPAHRPRHDEE